MRQWRVIGYRIYIDVEKLNSGIRNQLVQSRCFLWFCSSHTVIIWHANRVKSTLLKSPILEESVPAEKLTEPKEPPGREPKIRFVTKWFLDSVLQNLSADRFICRLMRSDIDISYFDTQNSIFTKVWQGPFKAFPRYHFLEIPIPRFSEVWTSP